MNRNTESHFSTTPTVDIPRSKFDRSFTNKTTFDAADLIPFYVDTTIMPGDTVNMNVSEVVRLMTPITPVMDNANLDIYFFFVPNRLIWKHWKQFMGENDTAPWKQTVEYEIPQIVAPSAGWKKGSLADYFGYPTNIGSYKASALPFRAYALIWNEWFRDQNLKNPCYISDGDADITGTDKSTLGASYDYVVDTEKGAAPCKVAKYHDYFTSCLPEPQKGPSISIPLGKEAPLKILTGTNPVPLWSDPYFTAGTDNQLILQATNRTIDPPQSRTMPSGSYAKLGVDLSLATSASINQLRQAFAIQKFYEKQALYGTRYIEMIKGHFHVTNPDFRMQRPEYLGGSQIPININQVVQTDATSQLLGGKYVEEAGVEVWKWNMSDQTPQGNTAAYSLTTGKNQDLFTHSFTEHGWVIGLAVVRTVHTYQQGLNRMFSRKSMFDFYWPEFANLGNQAIYNKEIYLQNTSADDQVFGYQEAWAEYRYLPDIVTGEMRSNYSQSLDIWHWADDYSALPTLGDDWIEETKNNVERTLAVQDHDQFFGDFYFNCIMTRPMPLYSVPGLIDHH